MPDQNEIAKKLVPAIGALAKACEDAGLSLTGFVADFEEDILIRFGSIPHVRGMDFIRLNASLAYLTVLADAQGASTSVFEQPLAPTGQDPLEIADRLAMAAIITPSSEVPDRILDLAREYADARSAPNA